MINPKHVSSSGFRVFGSPPEMTAKWRVPNDLAYFDGHFPGRPTLPAVAMIDLTLELIRTCPGFARAELTQLKSAKFTAVIEPGDEIEIHLKYDETSRSAEWRAEWKRTVPDALDGARGGAGVAASFGLSVRG